MLVYTQGLLEDVRQHPMDADLRDMLADHYYDQGRDEESDAQRGIAAAIRRGKTYLPHGSVRGRIEGIVKYRGKNAHVACVNKWVSVSRNHTYFVIGLYDGEYDMLSHTQLPGSIRVNSGYAIVEVRTTLRSQGRMVIYCNPDDVPLLFDR